MSTPKIVLLLVIYVAAFVCLTMGALCGIEEMAFVCEEVAITVCM